MRLESMIAEVRPRNPWEAIDLGWVLTRSCYGSILRAWMVMVWPVWLVILVLLRDSPLWAAAVVWWLKPLAERVPLLILSRTLFGETPSPARWIREWPRVWFDGALHHLISGRLSPARTVVLPVRELEGLRGTAYRRRAGQVADRGGGGAAWWSLVFHAGMVHSLSLSLILLSLVMIPERYAPDLEVWGSMLTGMEEMPYWARWTWTGLYLLSLTLVTPFCVGAGFGLYLTARTKMEGWDIELVFRKLADRISAPVAGLGLVAVLALAVGFLPGARAAEELDPGAEVAEILARPEFKIHTRTEYREVRREAPGWLQSVFGLLGSFGGTVANVILVILSLLAFATVVVLLVRWILSIRLAGFGLSPPPRPPTVTTVMGMNVREDSLPRDVVGAARKLFAAGDYDAAMALLYRGALSWLVHRGGVAIRESDTERDCVEKVRLVCRETTAYFELLTRAWVGAAYGTRRIGLGEVERLLAEWPFGAKAKEVG